MLPRIRPMRLRLVREPFDDPDYIYELKHDGWRAIAYAESGECKLVSRNSNRLRFEKLRQALSKLPVANAILDGEIVVLDQNGVSQFNALLSRRGADAAIFYAFDLMWLDGVDLRRSPLIVRKQRLCELVRQTECPRLLYAQQIEASGKALFDQICARDIEGIVGKHRGGTYHEDKPDWIKVKNRSYSQAEGRREMLTRKKR